MPYTYFADQKLRDGNLRAKYDVIIYPAVGGTRAVPGQRHCRGPATRPLPYKKTDATPNLGAIDQSDDIRGGMGVDGLMELYKFVQEGGTLITEGSTATIFPEYNLVTGRDRREPRPGSSPAAPFCAESFTDKKSPLAYGYDGSPAPGLFQPESGAERRRRRRRIRRLWRWRGGDSRSRPEHDPHGHPAQALTLHRRGPARGPSFDRARRSGRPRRWGRGWRRGGGFGGFGGLAAGAERPRVVMQFPSNPDDMLLSGTLVGGQSLAGRAQLIDSPVGKGHVVTFRFVPSGAGRPRGPILRVQRHPQLE